MATKLFEQSPSPGGVAVIGKGMVIKGNIHSKQDLVLDGEIEGALIVENCLLTIGPHGKALANATAREMDIQGEVIGNVECTGKVSIRTSGQLVGDISAGGIVIESGAYFKGKVDIVNPRAQVKTSGEA
jgi:cytoskeletal protein CcmA (bactofilin family)